MLIHRLCPNGSGQGFPPCGSISISCRIRPARRWRMSPRRRSRSSRASRRSSISGRWCAPKAISIASCSRSPPSPGWSSTRWSTRRSAGGSNRAARRSACRAVSALDPVIDALSRLLGQEAITRPGGQHTLDAAYFDARRGDPVTRSRMTTASPRRIGRRPTSCSPACRARRRRRPRSISPIAATRSPTSRSWSKARRRRSCSRLVKPLVVGLTTSPDRLIQIRRNRLLSLNQTTETAYVDQERVARELAYARRMFSDHGWPVIDVTRRSIEETAAAIINLATERRDKLGAVASGDAHDRARVGQRVAARDARRRRASRSR